jgi:hypothetical protein
MLEGVNLLFKGVALAMVVVVGTLLGDLPIHDFWFWTTVYLLAYRNFIVSLIGGMPEPSDKSTDTYIWIFRSLHTMERRITPYRLHRSFWKLFEHEDKK